MPTDMPEPRRRGFLKGSLLVGASALTRPAMAGAMPVEVRTNAALPTEARAMAEAGEIDARDRDPEAPIIEHAGSDLMVDLLKAAGIKYVTATPGSTFRGLHESIVNYGGNSAPELISCVHEEISAAMAHGYAKVAGVPIACLVHSNVGLQHASMAIYNAWCDRAPVLVLAGNGLDATQRRPLVEWLHTMTDVGTIVRDYVKWDETPVNLEHYAESFMRAHQVATAPPCAPVMLVDDSDLQERDVPPAARPALPRPPQVAPPAGEAAAVRQAAALLIAAERPVIVADRAARTPQGVKLLVALAELLNAPVIDRGARMNMPTTHYLNQSFRPELIGKADVILGLELSDLWGTINTVADKAERHARRLAAETVKVVAISANYTLAKANVQDMQRYFSPDLTIAADAEACLPQLIEAVQALLSTERKAVLAARTPQLRGDYVEMRAAAARDAANGWDSSPISTARLSMELWDAIRPLDWGLVSNSAFISSWPQRLWDITEHHQYIGGEGGYGMGYGAPAAAGAALAHRDAGRIAVAIQTDGDMMVLPGTLWTLAHHKLPLLTVMHNNRAWHQETMHLTRIANRRGRGVENWRIGTILTDPPIDYAAMARSMGVWAEGPISDPARLAPALKRAVAIVKQGKPALLDIVTQPR